MIQQRILLTDPEAAALDALAKRWSMTRSELIEQSIREYIRHLRECYALDQAVREAFPR